MPIKNCFECNGEVKKEKRYLTIINKDGDYTQFFHLDCVYIRINFNNETNNNLLIEDPIKDWRIS